MDTPNIIEHTAEEAANRLAIAIDDMAREILQAPAWLYTWPLLLKWYCKFRRFEIKARPKLIEFWLAGQKRGELKHD